MRELQLEIATLKRVKLYHILRNYRLELERRLKKEERKFFMLNGPWLKEQIAVSIHSMKGFFENISPGEIEGFLELQRASIHRLLLVRRLAEADIHLLRKKVKNYYYTSRIFSGNNPSLDRIDSFQELLGEWHDAVIMQLSLGRVVQSGELNSRETGMVIFLLNELAGLQRQCYRRIHENKDELIRTLRLMRKTDPV